MPKEKFVAGLIPVAFGGLSLLAVADPAKALTTVCTADWQAPSGAISSGLLTAVAPCSPAANTAGITIGSGANAGTINGGDAITGTGTNNFTRTSINSVDIGINGNTTGQRTLTFTQAVVNPYLFFAYADAGTSFVFSSPFSLVQSNNAAKSGLTVAVDVGASNTQNDGFVVQMLGTYSSVSFDYVNTNVGAQSVSFTAGAEAVPAPLPLMGAGVAFGFSRRLRRRMSAGA